MRRWALIPLILWSLMAKGFDWKPPIALSHQGEPLEVRLEITDLASVKPAQLFPLLASELAFTERGIDRPEYLSGLTYAIDSIGDRVDLVIRTATAWNKSDLTTLIEVFTPNGPVSIPVSVQIAMKHVSITQADSKLVSQKPDIRITANEGLTVPASSTKVKNKILVVKNGSTLWRLANIVKPDALTIEQVMMALYDENPDAFEYNNVNALEKGKILAVPSVERLAQESAIGAAKRFDAHMKAPKKSFPLTPRPASEPVDKKVERRLIETQDQAASVSDKQETEELAVSATNQATEPLDQPQVPRNSAPHLLPNPAVNNILSFEVTELLEKITSLESKLNAMDVKFEEIATEAREKPPIEIRIPESQEPPTKTEFDEKIMALESKLDAMDAKVDVIAIEAKENSAATLSASESMQARTDPEYDLAEWLPSRAELEVYLQTVLGPDFDIDGWVPSWDQVEAFSATDLGKGVLILVAVVAIIIAGFRVFKDKHSSAKPDGSTPDTPSPQVPDLNFTATLESVSNPGTTSNPEEGALESAIERLKAEIEEPTKQEEIAVKETAIERLKSKIENPERQQEAEELYAGTDDSLIDAFSADTLNQNPEWGEDPDDEADVASHQLELAQNYLDMGMAQTAIELLERVLVSPDRASAEKARALLDAHKT
jgi:FimV-like protein